MKPLSISDNNIKLDSAISDAIYNALSAFASANNLQYP